jgi:hypothetical protein
MITLKGSITALLGISLCALSGCASRDASSIVTIEHDQRLAHASVGPWENRHPNDKNLVGIWIQQYPDEPQERHLFEGKHPCMVYYIFRSGRCHELHYEADGEVKLDDWLKPKEVPDWMLKNLTIIYDNAAVQKLISEKRAA